MALLAGLVAGGLKKATGGTFSPVKPPTEAERVREVTDAGFQIVERRLMFGGHSLFLVLKNP